jgi:predicted nucleic acid-binding Zn ribbon protein
MADEAPSRNDGVTTGRNCAACGRPFEPSGRRRHCSDACRQKAWRRRHFVEVPQVPVPPKGRKKEMTVYECDGCGAGELGTQRCELCNTWMHAIGVCNYCPCCSEPIPIKELMGGAG